MPPSVTPATTRASAIGTRSLGATFARQCSKPCSCSPPPWRMSFARAGRWCVAGRRPFRRSSRAAGPEAVTYPPVRDNLRTLLTNSKAHLGCRAPSAPVFLPAPPRQLPRAPYGRPRASCAGASSSPTSSVGSRARATGGASVGMPRCARMRRTGARSVMTATTRSRPWHLGHSRTSTERLRRSSVAQSTRGCTA